MYSQGNNVLRNRPTGVFTFDTKINAINYSSEIKRNKEN